MNYKIEGAIRKNRKNFIICAILWLILVIVFVAPFSFSVFQASASGKFALCYLTTNIFQKSYLANIELDALVIYIICIANILVCALFIYKGISIFLKSAK